MTDLVFYHSPGACSMVVHAALLQTKVPFEPRVCDVRAGQQHEPWYRAINPRGRVPALLVDGEVLTEVIAILLYLDSRFPDVRLLPAAGVPRAQAIAWLSWFASTVHPLFRAYLRPEWLADGDAEQATLKCRASKRIESVLSEIEAALGQDLGRAQLSVLDYAAAAFLRWSSVLPEPQRALCPALQQYRQRLANDALFQQVLNREGVDLISMKRRTDP